MGLPILYSFVRCPYAIRARMALAYAGINYKLREVSLKNKPAAMLTISPKGTTPVLQIGSLVLEESLDIMRWALSHHDPDRWQDFPDRELLISRNDQEFKPDLDRYKYYVRYTEPQAVYRQQAEKYLQVLEALLNQHQFLYSSDRLSLADVAIFPFIRQFAGVDRLWWQNSSYNRLKIWLNYHESSMLFQQVMSKTPVWSPQS